MKVYIDITLLPDNDIGHHFLWEKVFQQVHLALVEIKDAEGLSPVGIGFPEYNEGKKQLGRKLRLFAPDEKTFDRLDIKKWLSRFLDYVHIKKVQPVPATCDEFIRFRRYQTKSNIERQARRTAARKSVSYEEALAERECVSPVMTDAPYIWMKSLGNGNRFRLFIKSERVKNAGTGDGYSTYGLSNGGVLPYF